MNQVLGQLPIENDFFALVREDADAAGDLIVFDAEWNSAFLGYSDIRECSDTIFVNDCVRAGRDQAQILFQTPTVQQQGSAGFKSVRRCLPGVLEDGGS